MTDNEIIKALDKCITIGEGCEDCPFYEYTDCNTRLKKCFRDLIKRKDAEIEQWKEEANKYQSLWCEAVNDTQRAKSEAIKEHNEKVKNALISKGFHPAMVRKAWEEIEQEMTE